jgi:predicted transcriptional regulator
MDEVRLLVEGLDEFFDGASNAAKRIDRRDFGEHPERISFESMELLLRVLTPNRWTLLRKLRALGPSSIRALAHELRRDYRGVHSDVAALREVGLIERRDDGKVLVPWSRIVAEMSVDIAA